MLFRSVPVNTNTSLGGFIVMEIDKYNNIFSTITLLSEQTLSNPMNLLKEELGNDI